MNSASFLVFAAAAFECTVHATDVVTRGFVSLIANIIALFTAMRRIRRLMNMCPLSYVHGNKPDYGFFPFAEGK